MFSKAKWLAGAAYLAIRRPKMNRQKGCVLDEYSAGWESYFKYLDRCETLDEWMRIRGVEDVPHFCNVSGQLEFGAFDSLDFNRQKILEILRRDFPEVQSVTEYGCGLGRNLLFLKRHMPNVEFYGYELCQPGVEIARSAAKKFHLDVNYSQLDYVGGSEDDYIFPPTDVAFTMYSLEQLPTTNKQAMENILRHTKCGSIHLEPVPENYPLTLRGMLGRLDHWKADYLKNFEKNVSSLELGSFKKQLLNSAHNPLMFPTLYVLRKRSPQ